MSSLSLQLRRLLLFSGGFLCLHAISIAVFRSHATQATYPFLLLAPVLALLACWRRAAITTSGARITWALLTAGLLLWTAGMVLSAWEELLQHMSPAVAFVSDFVFFLYGVPILLAISPSPSEQRIPIFIWLDGIQAILTAYLAYITLFAVVPFTTRSLNPISESLLVLTYNVENLVLACAVTLRLLTQPNPGEERRFLQLLCGFLWCYAVFAGIYNYVSSLTDGHSLIDVMVDPAFLFLAVAALLPFAQVEEAASIAAKRPFALFLDNVSPIFYTLALLSLGIIVARSYFYIGIGAIVVVVIVYGIRNTVLQSRYIRSQRTLQEARDRLEETSLKDGLTNVANRRCFDQVLEQEWNRAVRTQHPLSLLLIDIDHFKILNDSRGHRYGDRCLIEISAALQSVLSRSGDLLARYGGEEFAVILPATGIGSARVVAGRLQEAIRSLQIEDEFSSGHCVTVSIGATTYDFPQPGSPAVLIEASDRALYLAKQNGRNRIEFCSMQAVLDSGSLQERTQKLNR